MCVIWGAEDDYEGLIPHKQCHWQQESWVKVSPAICTHRAPGPTNTATQLPQETHPDEQSP